MAKSNIYLAPYFLNCVCNHLASQTLPATKIFISTTRLASSRRVIFQSPLKVWMKNLNLWLAFNKYVLEEEEKRVFGENMEMGMAMGNKGGE